MLALYILTMHQIITLLMAIKLVSMEYTIRCMDKHVDETKLPINAIMSSEFNSSTSSAASLPFKSLDTSPAQPVSYIPFVPSNSLNLGIVQKYNTPPITMSSDEETTFSFSQEVLTTATILPIIVSSVQPALSPSSGPLNTMFTIVSLSMTTNATTSLTSHTTIPPIPGATSRKNSYIPFS